MSEEDIMSEPYVAPVDTLAFGTLVCSSIGTWRAVIMRWDAERGGHVEAEFIGENQDRTEAEAIGRPYCSNRSIPWRV